VSIGLLAVALLVSWLVTRLNAWMDADADQQWRR
jgi:hypothetical protein